MKRIAAGRNEHIARLVRLNDRVDPAARRAITNVGLFFVSFLHLRPQLFQFFGRGFFVAAIPRARQNAENTVSEAWAAPMTA